MFFQDPLFEELTTSLGLGLASHGGGEPAEISAVCAQIQDGDDAAWYSAWSANAERLVSYADASAGGGHAISARDAYLRAATYFGLAYRPLFGAPVDRRLVEAFGKQRAAFDHFAALLEPAGELLEFAFEGARLPAYLFKASTAHESRPLVIATDGYDATLYDMYLAHAVPALRRGYDCLVFDGPGQGALLYEQGVSIRPDWEQVVRTVVDGLMQRDDVDHTRMVLVGWSLGGYLALRAASAEHRLAACVADPGLFGILAAAAARMQLASSSSSAAAAAASPSPMTPDAATLSRMSEAIQHNRMQRWSIVQRGYWVHGVQSLGDYLASASGFTLEGRLGDIECPTLLTAAENDSLSATAERVFDGLRCPKTLVRFLAAEGAGQHCEMGNRSLLDQRVFDWLDHTLRERSDAARGTSAGAA